MRPLPIGIIGGAGPLAGAALLERLVTLSTSRYGCYRDVDFPQILLISFPFSEMLNPEINVSLVKKELKQCLSRLRNNGTKVLAIACNTLHTFIDLNENLSDLVHMLISLDEKFVKTEPLPLVLCTSTSRKFGLHKRFFNCVYPSSVFQEEIDAIIDQVLMGVNKEALLIRLKKVIKEQPENTIVLGCTELSLLAKDLGSSNKRIIDPLDILAEKLLKISFKRELS